jgi:hypothetical protein
VQCANTLTFWKRPDEQVEKRLTETLSSESALWPLFPASIDKGARVVCPISLSRVVHLDVAAHNGCRGTGPGSTNWQCLGQARAPIGLAKYGGNGAPLT